MADQKKSEIWEPIKGFSSYEISNRGKIRSKKRKVWHEGSKTHMKLQGKLMRQRWNKLCKCYFLDLIDDAGERRTVYPHKETAKVYVSNDDLDKNKIIHKDNNSRNNYFENLQWMNPSEHMKWQFQVGNKDNHKVWKTRKKRYKNGFKSSTVILGRPKKKKV